MSRDIRYRAKLKRYFPLSLETYAFGIATISALFGSTEGKQFVTLLLAFSIWLCVRESIQGNDKKMSKEPTPEAITFDWNQYQEYLDLKNQYFNNFLHHLHNCLVDANIAGEPKISSEQMINIEVAVRKSIKESGY